MKIAVTGGSGQLGTLVLRRLIANKAIKEVVTIDLRPPVVAGAKIHTIKADIRDGNFAQYLHDCGIHIVDLKFFSEFYGAMAQCRLSLAS